jgi:hypothetical protein
MWYDSNHCDRHAPARIATRPAGLRIGKTHGLSNGFATYDDDMGTQHEEGLLPGIYSERRASVVTDRAELVAEEWRCVFPWFTISDPHAPGAARNPISTNTQTILIRVRLRTDA